MMRRDVQKRTQPHRNFQQLSCCTCIRHRELPHIPMRIAELSASPLNSLNEQGLSPLAYAALAEKSIPKINQLLEQGADINLKVEIENVQASILYFLVCLRLTGLVSLFCQQTTLNPNLGLDTGWTPLHEAVEKGYEDIVRSLCAHPKINLNVLYKIPGSLTYTNALMLAIKKNNEPMFDILTHSKWRQKIDFSQAVTSPKFDSLSGIACTLERYLLIVKKFTWFRKIYRLMKEQQVLPNNSLAPQDRQADLNHNESYFYSDFHCIVFYGGEEIIPFLCEQVEPIDMMDSLGNTALLLAAKYGCVQELVALLKFKADFRIADAENRSPLYLAARHGHFEVLKLLMAAFIQDWKSGDAEVFRLACGIAEVMGHRHVVDWLRQSNTPFGLCVNVLQGCIDRLPLFQQPVFMQSPAAMAIPPVPTVSHLAPILSAVPISAAVAQVAPKPVRALSTLEIKFESIWEGHRLVLPERRIAKAIAREGCILLHPLSIGQVGREMLIGYFAISPDVVAYFEKNNQVHLLRELLNASCLTRESGKDGFKQLKMTEKFKLVVGRAPRPSCLGNKMKFRDNKIRPFSEKILGFVKPDPASSRHYDLFWFCGVGIKQG